MTLVQYNILDLSDVVLKSWILKGVEVPVPLPVPKGVQPEPVPFSCFTWFFFLMLTFQLFHNNVETTSFP